MYNNGMPERRVAYQTVPNKQQMGLSLEAPSLQRLFIDAGLALNDYRISLDLVRDEDKQTVRVQAGDKEGLMLAWLQRLADLFNEKQFLATRIVFRQFDGKSIDAYLSGETYQPTRHGYAKPIVTITGPISIREAPSQDGSIVMTFFFAS